MAKLNQILKKNLWNIIVNSVANSPICIPRLRYHIYKISGININTRKISSHCIIRSSKLNIGKGSWINDACFFDNYNESITIGENCGIGMNVMFITATHKVGITNKRAGENAFFPIVVENGVWIGAKATLLPGIKIREGVVIAAGSLVNKDCEKDCLYAGVPAKKIRKLIN